MAFLIIVEYIAVKSGGSGSISRIHILVDLFALAILMIIDNVLAMVPKFSVNPLVQLSAAANMYITIPRRCCCKLASLRLLPFSRGNELHIPPPRDNEP